MTHTHSARIRRRELHSSRSSVAVFVLILAIVLVAWLATEAFFVLLGAGPFLLAPSAVAAAIGDPATIPLGVLLGVGIPAAILGLILVILALAPGKRGRRVRHSERAAVIIDDSVIASALAAAAARSASLSPSQVSASVGRRDVSIQLTPTSGVPVDGPAVHRDVEQVLTGYQLEPALTVRVSVSATGAVGA